MSSRGARTAVADHDAQEPGIQDQAKASAEVRGHSRYQGSASLRGAACSQVNTEYSLVMEQRG